MSRDADLSDSAAWTRLVDAANPASILVVIASRMDAALCQRVDAEDILQETLFKAWEARSEFMWRGVPALRRMLIRIAERVIQDYRDHVHAQKRSMSRTVSLAAPGGESSHSDLDPWTTTTPSRVAAERERAKAMMAALDELPDDVREVIRLRLFEELTIEEVSARLGLGESAVRHRFRNGASVYREALKRHLETSSRPPR